MEKIWLFLNFYFNPVVTCKKEHLIAGPFVSRKISKYCVAEIGGGGELQHRPVYGVIIK